MHVSVPLIKVWEFNVHMIMVFSVNVMKEIYQTKLAGIILLRAADWLKIHYVTGRFIQYATFINHCFFKEIGILYLIFI